MNTSLHRRDFLRHSGILSTALALGSPLAAAEKHPFSAGVAAVDISPKKLPVICNGGFLEAQADHIVDPLHARAVVLDDGSTRLALVVVDVCILETELCDRVREAAAKKTEIPFDNILLCATHTHSSGSVLAALGSRRDEAYYNQIQPQLVDVIRAAAANPQPARVGWGAIEDYKDTHCRVWIRRPDCIGNDPFGNRTVRAMMHPGHCNPAYIGPCGPVDSMLTLLSVQSNEGKPLAVLANYSMHYFGAAPISADYYGDFARALSRKIGANGPNGPAVVMMSQGTSGDQHWMDYGEPREKINRVGYANRVAEAALGVYKEIEYHDHVPLAAESVTLRQRRRVPDDKRLAWAREVIASMGERTVPRNKQEVYAHEAIILHEEPVRDVPLSVFQIGDFGITAMSNEVYAITGLKLKQRSPFALSMNIELANGGEGYIPPPELHPFGGYNTWPARSAALVPGAEPVIVEKALQLQEKLTGRKRRVLEAGDSPYRQAVLADKPSVYWRMQNIDGWTCPDSSGDIPGTYEPCVAYYLDGPTEKGLRGDRRSAPAAHFAGGRLGAELTTRPSEYTFEAWCWNGLPVNLRLVTGYLFSLGQKSDRAMTGDHLGIGGTENEGAIQGKLFVFNGDERYESFIGKTRIPEKTWCHVVMVRAEKHVQLYLNGKLDASGELQSTLPRDSIRMYVGGRCDNRFNWEGKLCEAALYSRALSAQDVEKHFQAGVLG